MLPILKRTGGALFVCSLAAAGVFGTVRVPAAAETAGNGPVVEHEVIKNDNLMLLAGYYYGNPREWREIYSRNRGKVSDPSLLLPGTVLKVRTDPGRQWPETYEEFLSRVRR